MQKSAEAFRSIGEVAKLIGVAPHVLRYWETQFSQLKPMKRPDGRRYYRPEDVRLAAGLCEVLRDDGMTIRGAKKMLARDRGESVRQRGAARLEGILGLALTDNPVHPAADREGDIARGDRRASRAAAILGDDRPDPIMPEEDRQDMTEHSPRSRQRRRRHAHSDDPLPLFPDLDRQPGANATWLARLAGLAAALRDQPQGGAPIRRARPQLLALRDAIATLY